MNYWQQGDCLIKPTNKIGGTFDKKRNVLIEGEHTGHAHRVTEGHFEIYTEMQQIFLKAISECKITHEEHNPITIPPGIYEIDQVREYDPFQKAIERVRD